MKTKQSDIADFYMQFSMLLKSGLPLPDSLYELGKEFRKADFRHTLIEISEQTKKGERLSDAMEAHPQYFDPITIKMIKNAESSNILPETLEEIAHTTQLNYRLTAMFKEVSFYPVVAFGFTFAIIIGISVYIIGNAKTIFDDMFDGMPLPYLTDKVLSLSSFIRDYDLFFMILLVIYVLFALWLFAGSISAGKIFQKIILILPGTRRILKNLNMAKISSLLAIFIRQKVPEPEALQITASLVDSRKIKNALKRAGDEIKAGNSFYQSLHKERVIDGMIPLTIKHVPEKDLPEQLANLAKLFTERTSSATRQAGVVWATLLIFLLSSVIGITILALILPFMSIITRLGGG